MGTINKHVTSRVASFRAARLAISEQISMREAGEKAGSKRTSVQEAYTILMLGTPEEISAAESGLAGIGPIVADIRSRTTEEQRKAVARKPVRGPASYADREFDAQIWARFRDALDALTGMPITPDVMTIVKKNPQRAEYVSRKVLTAHTWLEDFVNAWTK
jgi:hypothetical protein